ncbi:hypothetical protein ACFQY5_20160 [Paeniroseomonas aquatica]|uniref:hypothetical protein n=1 Tax=Paeniroseomonas aquatica TaxID=373043 RepID=UPI00360C2998
MAATTAGDAMAAAPTNPVTQKMAAGGVALGLGVRMSRSAEIARIARATGHDFLFIDLQHSLFGLETVGHIAQAALALGIARWRGCARCGTPTSRRCWTTG